MPGQLNGKAVATTTAGFVLLWSGVKGATVGQTLRSLLKGENPARVPEASPSVGVSPAAGSGSATNVSSATTTSSIANDALKYQGHAYLYGGAPGTAGMQPWDCSSFCNWVLGHDLGMTLPGSSSPGYSGTSHGPTTLSYLAWSTARTVSHSASDSEAGDLCVWQTHMGIALGGSQMISALDPSLGTMVTSISGGAPPGELLYVRRVIIGNPEA